MRVRVRVSPHPHPHPSPHPSEGERSSGTADVVPSSDDAPTQTIFITALLATYDGQTKVAGGPLGRLRGHDRDGRRGLRWLINAIESGYLPDIRDAAADMMKELDL